MTDYGIGTTGTVASVCIGVAGSHGLQVIQCTPRLPDKIVLSLRVVDPAVTHILDQKALECAISRLEKN